MAQQEQFASSGEAWGRVKSRLRAELGEDVFASWFRGVELERLDDNCVHLTVATRFLRNWLRSHYYEFVLKLLRAEWADVDRVEFRVRQPHFAPEAPKEALTPEARAGDGRSASGTIAAADRLWRVRGLAARSQAVLRHLSRRRLEPAGSRCRPGSRRRLRHAAAIVQSAVRPWQRRLGQDPFAPRHFLGHQAAKARSAGALPHRRALHVRLRPGASAPATPSPSRRSCAGSTCF